MSKCYPHMDNTSICISPKGFRLLHPTNAEVSLQHLVNGSRPRSRPPLLPNMLFFCLRESRFHPSMAPAETSGSLLVPFVFLSVCQMILSILCERVSSEVICPAQLPCPLESRGPGHAHALEGTSGHAHALERMPGYAHALEGTWVEERSQCFHWNGLMWLTE